MESRPGDNKATTIQSLSLHIMSITLWPLPSIKFNNETGMVLRRLNVNEMIKMGS